MLRSKHRHKRRTGLFDGGRRIGADQIARQKCKVTTLCGLLVGGTGKALLTREDQELLQITRALLYVTSLRPMERMSFVEPGVVT